MAVSFRVRCTFASAVNVADGEFMQALELAGLLYWVEGATGLAFELAAPAGISACNTGHWAARACERLASLYDWSVEVVPVEGGAHGVD